MATPGLMMGLRGHGEFVCDKNALINKNQSYSAKKCNLRH